MAFDIEALEAWKASLPAAVLQVSRAMLRAGRNDAPFVLLDALDDGQIAWTPDHLQPLVADAWSAAEAPELDLGADLWVSLFSAADYPRPPEPLTLYRGCSPHRRRGMAWSTDIERARWFARRFLTQAGPRGRALYETTAPPDAVLAMVDGACVDGGRHEAEVVVDPTKLAQIRRAENYPVPLALTNR